ncbi:hypothetical protein [Clostridium sp. HBUAS56017]|uniref:hypothetical protein n=1 Tax=Clostridium sp. HBUAS56017 TaxID=2571128 RepID=UPI00163D7998|nr:hypothetical protein [Clostridium sp. HBUAS56017]
MRKKKPIEIVVHYPETKEGWDLLKKSQATVMIDILENKLGEERVEELFEYMKSKKQTA